MDFKFHMCSSDCCVFFLVGLMSKGLRCNLSNIAIFTLVSQRFGLHTNAFRCYTFHGLLFLRTIHPSFWRTGASSSSLWHFPTTECSVLSIMRSLVVACDCAVCDHYSNLNLARSSCGVIVSLLARLRTCVHDYGFLRLITGSAFQFASAYLTFQRLGEVDWMQCNTDDRWN